MTDLADCARFLAEIASKEGRGALAVTTIDDYLIRNGGGAAALRKAFDGHDPPDTPTTDAIRSKLDNLTY